MFNFLVSPQPRVSVFNSSIPSSKFNCQLTYYYQNFQKNLRNQIIAYIFAIK